MSNPIIPKEKLSAYQRWELNSFNEAEARPAATPASADHNVLIEQVGYERGRAAGVHEGELKAAAHVQKLRALLANIATEAEAINQQLADDLIELALEIARRMAHEALELRRELIVPVVQDALAQLVRPLRQPVLALHPQDAAIVRENLGDQLAVDGWKLVEDAEIAPGGCKLQTIASQIDATVAARWQRLAAALGKSAPWIRS